MDTAKMKKSTEDLKAGYSNQTYVKKPIKDGQNLVRLLGDFCMIWRYWIPCIGKDDELKKIPFTVARRNQKDDLEFTPLLKALTGGTVRAKESNYQGGLFEYQLVGEYGKKVRQYTYADTDIFNFFAFASSGTSEEDTGEVKVSPPKAEIIVNCIDRDEPVNACKLFVKSESSLGISGDIWQAIVDVQDAQGNPEEYDILVKKTGKGTDTKYSVQRPSKRAVPKVVESELTEEELDFERYDVYEVGKLSSAKFTLKYLGDKIQELDSVMGSNIYGELQAIAQNEQDIPDEKEEEIAPKSVQKKETQKPATKEQPKPATSGRVPLQKKEEPKKEKVEDIPEEACVECGTMFPVTDTVCPKCGMQYQ